jgi:hypothetical protein
VGEQELLLTASKVQDYLADHGLCPGDAPISIRGLGGGVSNTARPLEWRTPGGEEKRWVVK